MSRFVAVIVTAALLSAGCVTDTGTGAALKPSEATKQADPTVGMSKAQVLALYGKTDNIRVGPEGETWIYNLNAAQAHSWNLGYRPQLRIVDFDKEGRVKGWNYSE